MRAASIKTATWVRCTTPHTLDCGVTTREGAVYFVLEVWGQPHRGCTDHGPGCTGRGLELAGNMADGSESFCSSGFTPITPMEAASALYSSPDRYAPALAVKQAAS
jgi:hypothetical protein